MGSYEKPLYPAEARNTLRQQKREEARLAYERHCRFQVHYDLAYDSGGSQWIGYYRTEIGARIAAFFNVHVRSWGGTVTLKDKKYRHDW